jgi:hypothetical protein
MTPLLPVTSKRKGSPRETVRIYKSGTARLSEDLVIANAFDLWVDDKERTLHLIPHNKWRPSTLKIVGQLQVQNGNSRDGRRAIWYGNPAARCAFIAIQIALDMLHLTAEKAHGLYRATVVDGCVVVQLKKKLREAV